ncbi:MAG: alpha/beta hydrolase [Puia sp.]
MSIPVSVRNNVKISGKGSQPILFAHGFGCDQHMWRLITPAFEEDYRIILFDYVGAGKSDLNSYYPDRYASLQGYAQDILDVCGELDLQDIIFAGHSVSSMIGLLAALSRPRIFQKMLMIGPSPCYINEGAYKGGFERADIDGLMETMERNYIGWSNFLAPQIMGNADRPELGLELSESFCSTDPEIAGRFAKATFFSDNRKDLDKLKIPTLILQCSEDIIAPLEVGQYLSKHIPNSTLKIMRATGHCPQLSAPAETIELIKEYLATNT